MNISLKNIFLSAVAAVFLLSCSSSTDEKILIKFWTFGSEGENVQKLLPEFERQNPGIKIIVQQIPWIAAHEKLLTGFAGNSLPDICQLGNTWIPEFAMLGALEPLTKYIDSSPQIRAEKYFAGIWNSNIVDSTVYGIPWYVDTRVLFYRKDILAAVGYTHPPKTWDELKDVSRKIVNSGKRKRYAIFLPTNEWLPSVLFGMEAGSTLLKDNMTRGNFSGKEFKTGYDFLRSFYEERLAPSSMMEVMNVYQGFAEGYFAMYITGPWNIGEFERRLPPELKGKWGTAPLPGRTDSLPGVSLPGGSSFVIFKHSPHKEAVWKFIEYLSQPNVQLQFYQLTGNLPAQKESWNDTLLTKNELMQAFLTQFTVVRSPAKIPEWEQIAQKIQDFSETAARQTKPNTEILKELDSYVDQFLTKRRWLFESGKLPK
ncbi:MAG: sugar ABC transporter substrate-binding protein [Bacteroidetes bacterium]|nr:sugar ABC transporter substrate-binding protein [Bacteroidota bacterium]